MKKRILPLYSIIAISIVVLLSCFVLIADVLSKRGIYFYIGMWGLTPGDVFTLIFLVGGTLFVSAIAVFLHKNFRSKWLKILMILVASIIACVFLFKVMVVTALFMPRSYVQMTSDNGEHCIVVGEDCYFFSPYGGDLYEKTSFCTMKKLQKYETAIDFYTPFSDGNYYVVWNENDFELYYDYGGDENQYRAMVVQYAK